MTARLSERFNLALLIGAGIVALTFLYVVVQDLLTCLFSPLGLKVGFIFGAVQVVFMGIVLPCLFMCSLLPEITPYNPHELNHTLSFKTRTVRVLARIILVLIPICSIAGFCAAEFILFPFTAIPLSTTLSGMAGVALGAILMRGWSTQRRIATFMLILIVPLPLRFIDWDSQKRFAKHLYRVQRGMNSEQVGRIMEMFMKNTTRDESERDLDLVPGFTGSTGYHHTNEGWGNANYGEVIYQNGAVVDVEMDLSD